MENPARKSVIPVEKDLPPIGNQVIVVCKGHEGEYRCAGYRDEKGVWRGTVRKEELKNVIGWLEFEANR
jgi:hypothetical protein